MNVDESNLSHKSRVAEQEAVVPDKARLVSGTANVSIRTLAHTDNNISAKYATSTYEEIDAYTQVLISD